jgi:hypothetical protein
MVFPQTHLVTLHSREGKCKVEHSFLLELARDVLILITNFVSPSLQVGRVTRLGEFSPVGYLFSLVKFKKNTE